MLLSELKSRFTKSLTLLYPAKEAESLFDISAEFILKYSKSVIHQNLYKNIQPEAEKKMQQVLSRLKKGEPIQYITGYAEFYGIPVRVDKRVLIPRQETELLVDMVLKDTKKNEALKIIDLCTGSGCIAIALSRNLPEAIVSVTDSSREALDAAKENAAMNGCDIEFICDDLLHPSRNYDKYDCIVSNPPYVRKSEKQFMHSNVLDFEPHGALFVEDADPLIFYRAIAEFSGKYLVPGGDIYLEINEYLGKETGELFERSGFRKVTISKDLQNKNRYLTAKK